MQWISNHGFIWVRHTGRRRPKPGIAYLICLIWSVQAQSSTQSDFDYYDIEASSGRELIAQMSSKTSNGFSAYTHWAISYQFTTSQRSGDCRLNGTDVSLSIRYQMPRWTNKAQADLALQTRWEDWYASLLTHEQEHGAHGMAAYESVNDQFSQISSEASCAELGAKLADIVSQTKNEYLDKSMEFDKRTQHGELEGAALVNLLDANERPPAMASALEADESLPVKKALKFLGAFVLLFWIKRRAFG